jgi:hypothetical protein
MRLRDWISKFGRRRRENVEQCLASRNPVYWRLLLGRGVKA